MASLPVLTIGIKPLEELPMLLQRPVARMDVFLRPHAMEVPLCMLPCLLSCAHHDHQHKPLPVLAMHLEPQEECFVLIWYPHKKIACRESSKHLACSSKQIAGRESIMHLACWGKALSISLDNLGMGLLKSGLGDALPQLEKNSLYYLFPTVAFIGKGGAATGFFANKNPWQCAGKVCSQWRWGRDTYAQHPPRCPCCCRMARAANELYCS
jgi:hypothetical protein